MSWNDIEEKSCCFCWLLCYSSIQNWILLRWAYPNLDQDQTESSSLLTETGYYDAVSRKEMSRYNTKNTTKLAVTAFEIIYVHIERVTCSSGQEKAWSSFFFLHIYSLIILVIMQSLISRWRRIRQPPKPLPANVCRLNRDRKPQSDAAAGN